MDDWQQSLDERFTLLLEIIREAGNVAHGYFARRRDLVVEHKGVQDFVSIADRAVEGLIRTRLQDRFPQDSFLGEESGYGEANGSESQRGEETWWVVDPIDGTTNFLRGLPHYAVSIAFVRDGVTELGAIYAPELGELYSARRGEGAFLNGERLHVSPATTLQNALVGVGYSKKTPAAAYLTTIEALLQENALYRLLGSGALMLCQVAAGRLDAFFEAHLSAWDALAAQLLVREAGGLTAPNAAQERGWRGGPVLAANAALFEQLVTLSHRAASPTSE